MEVTAFNSRYSQHLKKIFFNTLRSFEPKVVLQEYLEYLEFAEKEKIQDVARIAMSLHRSRVFFVLFPASVRSFAAHPARVVLQA